MRARRYRRARNIARDTSRFAPLQASRYRLQQPPRGNYPALDFRILSKNPFFRYDTACIPGIGEQKRSNFPPRFQARAEAPAESAEETAQICPLGEGRFRGIFQIWLSGVLLDP